MTLEQFSRGRKLVFFGTLAATLVCLALNLFIFQGPYFYIIWPLILATAIGTCVALTIGWRQYCKRPETKKRGRNYGVAYGFLLIILIAFIFSFISYFDMLHQCQKESFWSNTCEEPIYYPLITTPLIALFLFAFGGFLAPIIGGFVGYKIARESKD